MPFFPILNTELWLKYISFVRFQASKPHNDPERILHRKYVEVCSLVRRLDERNQQLAARIGDRVIIYITICQVIFSLSVVVSSTYCKSIVIRHGFGSFIIVYNLFLKINI